MRIYIYFAAALLIGLSPLRADNSRKSVSISPETGYLSEISTLLDQNGYRMFLDSLNCDLAGSLEEEQASDSIHYTLVLRSSDTAEKIVVGSFSRPRLSTAQSRRELKKFLFVKGLIMIPVILLFTLRF